MHLVRNIQRANRRSLDIRVSKLNTGQGQPLNQSRFYAPWCGHCKNLQPAYEKAAKSLEGLAQVAAINCDDESNKSFCGSMGVQGFPTLKIIKPSKTKGKPIVEDYQGGRTAAAIVDAVKAAIPNHVKRISDKDLDAWLDSTDETTKAIVFSEKGTTAALLKVLANEYLNKIKIAQIRNKEKVAVEKFGVTKFPTLIVLPRGSKEPVEFDGSFSKDAMKAFLEQHVSSPGSQEDEQKSAPKEPEKKKVEDVRKSASDSSKFSEASASHASSESLEDIIGTSTIILEGSEPTESLDPIANAKEAPLPITIEELPLPIPTVFEETELRTQCLGEKTSTCILVLLPTSAEDPGVLVQDVSAALDSFAEIAEKHEQRGKRLFPFYSVPARNSGAAALRDILKLRDNNQLELVAVNSRRRWWRKYQGEKYDPKSLEDWVDNVRFGDGEKGKLPDELIIGPSTEEPAQETQIPKHEEL